MIRSAKIFLNITKNKETQSKNNAHIRELILLMALFTISLFI